MSILNQNGDAPSHETNHNISFFTPPHVPTSAAGNTTTSQPSNMATPPLIVSSALVTQTPSSPAGQNGITFPDSSSNNINNNNDGNNGGSSSGLSTGSQVAVALGVVIFALLLGSLGLWATTQSRAKREAYGRLNGTTARCQMAAETRTR
ncbi:hypothetical protein SPBR_02103 [Sporothrix brasiliensis 5110]|uniref:Uncharacterized protein n=1 Tax=Sporothrix brasiliensis 5110 TaxID=1398154 RepID=A0A0C2FJQ1_9PEZI|nr:uncharacterized protein SPBR_02103 [Sporothrix brasiliensis 5110]KIH91253.1 hypothetical protein SPBR_02103 [Sporothrix brasiliensis 5110]